MAICQNSCSGLSLVIDSSLLCHWSAGRAGVGLLISRTGGRAASGTRCRIDAREAPLAAGVDAGVEVQQRGDPARAAAAGAADEEDAAGVGDGGGHHSVLDTSSAHDGMSQCRVARPASTPNAIDTRLT